MGFTGPRPRRRCPALGLGLQSAPASSRGRPLTSYPSPVPTGEGRSLVLRPDPASDKKAHTLVIARPAPLATNESIECAIMRRRPATRAALPCIGVGITISASSARWRSRLSPETHRRGTRPRPFPAATICDSTPMTIGPCLCPRCPPTRVRRAHAVNSPRSGNCVNTSHPDSVTSTDSEMMIAWRPRSKNPGTRWNVMPGRRGRSSPSQIDIR